MYKCNILLRGNKLIISYLGSIKIVIISFILVSKRKRNRNWQVLQLRAKQTKLVLKQQSANKSAFIERSKTNLKELRAKYWEMKKYYKPEPGK